MFHSRLYITMYVNEKSQNTINIRINFIKNYKNVINIYLTQKLHSFFNSLLNNNFSTCDINTLANNGPKGLPIATPSICWYNTPLNKNMLSLVYNYKHIHIYT